MKHQQGAAMIIVLIVLLLIAVAGTIAMRSGVFGSRLAGNTQVLNLLINNNDSALTKFEDMDETDIALNFATSGMYAHLLTPATADDELVFCYDTTHKDTFEPARMAIISGSSPSRPANFCTATTQSSGRNATITQVHIRKNTNVGTGLFQEGRTLSTGTVSVEKNINLNLTSISITPSLATQQTPEADINACFQKSAFTDKVGGSTVEQCFAGLNIPHDVQSADFNAGNLVNAQR